MATSSLYGTSSESTGLYGIGAASGGTYFEWFIFQDSATAPATPTGGSWSFTTNTGTAPSGWVASPPPSPVNQVWVSLAIVDSRNSAALTWTTPGLMSNFGNSVANYLTFVATSAPAYSPGRLWYDTNQKAFSYYNDVTNNVVHVGQETQLKVHNNTGATITKGSPVYVTSTSSGFTYPNIALAQANTLTSSNCIGLVNETISSGAEGYVVIAGILTGANTGTFTVGDVLYLSPYSAGQLMNTVPPTGYAVRIGVVAYSNTPNGNIYVNQSNVFAQAGNIVGTVAIANGGTGSTTASGARTNLGLGTISTQNANSVAITGGSITGITDLAVADGGTGASTAADARTNLGAVGLTDTQTLTNKSISGSANTLTNIPNSALVNDSVNVNGVDLTLGAVQLLGADWILPSYAGNAGKVLALNPSASDVQWISAGGVGTVTSINVSGGTTGLTTFGGPITAAGTITLGGTLAIANGGTGQTTANASFNALAPSQSGNSGKYLTTDGTNTSWATNPLGTVTSVGGAGTVNGLTLTGTVTTSGNLTLGGTLNLSSPPSIGNTTPNTGNFTTLTENSSPVVVQSDIGSAPNEIPLNQYLGNLAYQDASSIAGPVGIGGALTLNAGTANGVAYLNGSKVLTSGSELTFNGTTLRKGGADSAIAVVVAGATKGVRLGMDATGGFIEGVDNTGNASYQPLFVGGSNLRFQTSGSERMSLDSSGNLGIGTSSPANKLDVAGDGVFTKATYGFVGVNSGTVQTQFAANAGSGLDIRVVSNHVMNFLTNNTERMRIDTAGNLGIGTSSPGNRLVVRSSGTSTAYAGNIGARFESNGAGYSSTIQLSNNVDASATIGLVGSNLAFGVGTTEMLRLDSSGNLGLGVTPSAWDSGIAALEQKNGSVLASAGPTMNYSANAYFGSGSWRYTTTAAASYFVQTNGSYRWYNAPSGTAGNAISFSQVMTLDASGNLLVGTTSASISADYRLSVSGTRGGEFKSTGGATAATNTIWNNATTGDNVFESFRTETSDTQRGSISYNRAGGLTAYNTTSDYRAKNIIGPVVDSGALIDSVPVYMGKMKGAAQERPMFIAHETPEYAHTGEKDAVDADGNPVYQQMDASSLIPVMWAEIQSLRARLAAANI